MEVFGYIILAIVATMVVSTVCYVAIRECEIAKIKAENTHYHITVNED